MDMKKTAEVVVLGSMLAMSMAAPLTVQAGSVEVSTKAQTHPVVTGLYVLEAFTLNISANVAMNYDDSTATAVAVTTASQKGMHTFGGTSNGGSVKQCEVESVSAPTPSVPSVEFGCPAAPAA